MQVGLGSRRQDAWQGSRTKREPQPRPGRRHRGQPGRLVKARSPVLCSFAVRVTEFARGRVVVRDHEIPGGESQVLTESVREGYQVGGSIGEHVNG